MSINIICERCGLSKDLGLCCCRTITEQKEPIVLVVGDSLKDYQRELIARLSEFNIEAHNKQNINHIYGKLGRSPQRRDYIYIGAPNVPPPNPIHTVFIDELKDFYPHQMKAYGELIEQRLVAKHNRWRWRKPRKAKGWRKHIRRMKAND